MKLRNFLFSILTLCVLFLSSCGPKDADIRDAVQKKISAENGLSAVTADVKDGVATLSGQAENSDVKSRATVVAADVKGVKSVVNNISIQQTAAPVQISPDDLLIRGVADATHDYPTVTGTVNDGVVTLTGTITRDKLPALIKAVNELNPRKVQNQLTVK